MLWNVITSEAKSCEAINHILYFIINVGAPHCVIPSTCEYIQSTLVKTLQYNERYNILNRHNETLIDDSVSAVSYNGINRGTE